MADNVKKIIKDRLLVEMLGSVKDAGGAEWSVVVLDAVTTKVMSYACRISEILDYGVSLVENISKRREPLPALSGIYFITPSDDSVRRLIDDFKTRPLYKTAHVFFSSKVTRGQMAAISKCPGLTARLRTCKEVNLEVLTIDRRVFVTDEVKPEELAKDRSLQYLFGEGMDGTEPYKREVATIANRLVTVFSSLKEFPSVRFRVAKPAGDSAEAAALAARALVSQRVAVEVHERLLGLQKAEIVPAGETCDLIILDRGFDPVAPVIHEWTYEAMAYDLLDIKGNVFEYESETQGGKAERKEHLLGEADEMWSDMRYKHFAAALMQITSTMDEFRAKNKVAAFKGQGGGGELDTRGMRGLVQSLPQYREQLARLGVHVEMGSRMNRIVEERRLPELAKLEQDLVFGDATSKEVIQYLSNNTDVPAEDKVRLLMCYVCTHPEKLDATKAGQWQKLAKLSDNEMAAVMNLECLGVPVLKRGSGSSMLGFSRRRKRAVRKEKEPDEDDSQFQLSRFVPMLQEILEDLGAGKLATDEFPFVRPPQDTSGTAAGRAASVRSRPPTWVTKDKGKNGGAAGPKGKRVVVFVLGGITRSEVRTAHKMSAKLGRDIVLGGTSIETPSTFLKRMRLLSDVDQMISNDLDEFRIDV